VGKSDCIMKISKQDSLLRLLYWMGEREMGYDPIAPTYRSCVTISFGIYYPTLSDGITKLEDNKT